MGLGELPFEVLSEIFDHISDVYCFMNIARVCRRFQTIIQSKVLIITDSPHASNYFGSIAKTAIHMEDACDLMRYTSVIKTFSYFIVEFTKRHSHEKSILADDYILNIVYNKKFKWQKIVRVLLTEEAMGMLRKFSPREPPKSHQHSGLEYVRYLEIQLMNVHRTLCLYNLTHNKPEYEKEQPDMEAAMVLMGHAFDFFNVDHLPRIYFHVNNDYDFTIRSRTLQVLNGVVNISMTLPRLPPLMKFLENSHIPNLRSINDISIETGLSLKIFEKFQHLESLSLQSSFTGNISLQLVERDQHVKLPSLKNLKVTGNALSLSDLELPNLEKLSIQIYGSGERSFAQTIFFKGIKCPSLLELDLEIGSLPEGFHYITEELREPIKNVEIMSISTHSKTFASVFENLEFHNLVDLTLRHNDIAVATDLPLKKEDFFEDSRYKLDVNKLKFPNLQVLNLFGFDKFNSSFINEKISYPKLRTMLVFFKVGEVPQNYRFKKENFPSLTKLCMKYSNRYGPLKKCDIVIEMDDLELLEKAYYDSNLLIRYIKGSTLMESKMMPLPAYEDDHHH